MCTLKCDCSTFKFIWLIVSYDVTPTCKHNLCVYCVYTIYSVDKLTYRFNIPLYVIKLLGNKP